jgi:hypothetical protein
MTFAGMILRSASESSFGSRDTRVSVGRSKEWEGGWYECVAWVVTGRGFDSKMRPRPDLVPASSGASPYPHNHPSSCPPLACQHIVCLFTCHPPSPTSNILRTTEANTVVLLDELDI